jgi:LDH2 family malate/lactate/ureidoglycolate dehydrogenase
MLGTNPIAFGIPTAQGPFVVDMATSLVAMGTVHDHASRSQPLKPGWALDAHGEPTLDATRAKAGSLAPFGEAKGYALGLAIEILVTSITGAAIGRDVVGTLDSDRICNKGDVFVMLKPSADRLLPQRLSVFLDAVRQSGGDSAVLVPGDRAFEARNRALNEGVSLPAALHRRLKELAGKEKTR